MKVTGAAWIIVLVFAAILSVGLLGQRGALTGQAIGSSITVTSGTILSVIAAIVAIGVLIVAGLSSTKK